VVGTSHKPQYTKEEFTFSTHTHKTKRTIKIKNPKTALKKLKEGKKENQQETTEIIRF
jgi:hypothetical protein